VTIGVATTCAKSTPARETLKEEKRHPDIDGNLPEKMAEIEHCFEERILAALMNPYT
jgi:hypothetical protein